MSCIPRFGYFSCNVVNFFGNNQLETFNAVRPCDVGTGRGTTTEMLSDSEDSSGFESLDLKADDG